MIFAVKGHVPMVMVGFKTQTRRSSDRYKVGKLYAVQECRTCKGISEGKIYISQVIREWKPDLSDIPEDAHFARSMRISESGYPIKEWAAKAEGGYTSEQYEALYEEINPGWTERYAYWFSFFTADEIEDCRSMSRLRLNSDKEDQ